MRRGPKDGLRSRPRWYASRATTAAARPAKVRTHRGPEQHKIFLIRQLASAPAHRAQIAAKIVAHTAPDPIRVGWQHTTVRTAPYACWLRCLRRREWGRSRGSTKPQNSGGVARTTPASRCQVRHAPLGSGSNPCLLVRPAREPHAHDDGSLRAGRGAATNAEWTPSALRPYRLLAASVPSQSSAGHTQRADLYQLPVNAKRMLREALAAAVTMIRAPMSKRAIRVRPLVR